MKRIIKRNLVKELNELPCYEQEIPQLADRVSNHSNRSELISTQLPCDPAELSRHRLVLGQRYMDDDIYLNHLHSFGYRSSGVLVMGVGKRATVENFSLLSLAKYLRVYHVKGRFGYATQNFFPDGHLVERTTYTHINKGKLDKVCGSAQAAHQKLIFQSAGVDLQSQEAYEMASQGLIRPLSKDTGCLLYNIKCIHFTPPDFTLEVHTINENDEFLANFVHDIGLRLRSTAVCTHIHRLRYGYFGLDHALLTKEWNLHGIINNIDYCRRQLTPNKLFTNIAVGDAGHEDSNRIQPRTGEMVPKKINANERSGMVPRDVIKNETRLSPARYQKRRNSVPSNDDSVLIGYQTKDTLKHNVNQSMFDGADKAEDEKIGVDGKCEVNDEGFSIDGGSVYSEKTNTAEVQGFSKDNISDVKYVIKNMHMSSFDKKRTKGAIDGYVSEEGDTNGDNREDDNKGKNEESRLVPLSTSRRSRREKRAQRSKWYENDEEIPETELLVQNLIKHRTR